MYKLKTLIFTVNNLIKRGDLEPEEGRLLQKDFRALDHSLSIKDIPSARFLVDKISKKLLELLD